MINRILMELYDDFEVGNVDSLIEFANKTFPNDGTSKLFIGCAVVMFSRAGCFKPRYSCTREYLESIVLSAKEKVGNSNLLAFYAKRVNTVKGVNKYLNEIVDDENIEKYADVILDYLKSFKPNFSDSLKKENALDKYLKSLDNKKN